MAEGNNRPFVGRFARLCAAACAGLWTNGPAGKKVLSLLHEPKREVSKGYPSRAPRRQFEGKVVGMERIKIPRDYRRVLKEIEGLMMAKRNTAESDHLDVLVTLVEA